MQIASRVRMKKMPSQKAKDIIEKTRELRIMELQEIAFNDLKRRRRPAHSPRLRAKPTNTLSSQPISRSRPARRKQVCNKDRQTR